MPYINIRIGTQLSDAQREALFEQTTHLMSAIMGKRREVTVIDIQESKPSQWSTNGTELSEEKPVGVYIDIKVTEGTNSPDEKAEMIASTVKMLQDVVGTIQEACYVVIDAIPSDSWGYNGKTQAARVAGSL